MTRLRNLSIVLALVALLSVGFTVPYLPIAIADTTTVYATANNDATGQKVHSGGTTVYGQVLTEDVERLMNLEIDCIDVKLRKQGSPTGNVEVGFIDQSTRNFVTGGSFGTKDVSTFTTSYTEYNFCRADSGYLMPNQMQFFGVKYTGGDSSNYIDVRRSNIGSGPDFEDIDSWHEYYSDHWHMHQDRDLWFELSNTYDTSAYDELGQAEDAHPCDQISEQFGWQVHYSSGGPNQNAPRCQVEETEVISTFSEGYASLSGNDLTVYTSTHYDTDYSQVSAMPNVKVTVYEAASDGSGRTNIESKFSSTNAEANYNIDDLSVGTHYIFVEVPMDDFPSCGTSSVTCEYHGSTDDLRFTVTVS